MKTTRYIVQYQDTPNNWLDTDSCHTEAESLAILAHKKNQSSLNWRAIRRDTTTTEEVISPAPATAESAT